MYSIILFPKVYYTVIAHFLPKYQNNKMNRSKNHAIFTEHTSLFRSQSEL